MANSYIELPKFFANNVINNEPGYDAIIIEEGLDEVGGKNIGFVTVPITFNIADTFFSERLAGNSFQFKGEWNLYNTINRETPVLTKGTSMSGGADTFLEINSDVANAFDNTVSEPGFYVVTFTLIQEAVTIATFTYPRTEEVFSFEFQLEADLEDVNEVTEKPIYASYLSKIIDVDGPQITVADSLDVFSKKTRQQVNLIKNDEPIRNWSIRFKNQDRRYLSTYLHLGGNNLSLITNFSTDLQIIPDSPYSIIYNE